MKAGRATAQNSDTEDSARGLVDELHLSEGEAAPDLCEELNGRTAEGVRFDIRPGCCVAFISKERDEVPEVEGSWPQPSCNFQQARGEQVRVMHPQPQVGIEGVGQLMAYLGDEIVVYRRPDGAVVPVSRRRLVIEMDATVN